MRQNGGPDCTGPQKLLDYAPHCDTLI